MIPSLYPYFYSPYFAGQVTPLTKTLMPIFIDFACKEAKSAHAMLKKLMDLVLVRNTRLSYLLGTEGVAWNKIQLKDKNVESYFKGVVDGGYFHLFDKFHEEFLPQKKRLQRHAGKYQVEAAMDYFGYDEEALEMYFASLPPLISSYCPLSEHCAQYQTLFEIVRRKNDNYLPVANRLLNRFYKDHKPLCRYLLRIGAKFDDATRREVSRQKELYEFYFAEDV